MKVINKAMSSKDDEKLKIYTRGAISSIHQQSIKNYERCGWWGKPFNEKNPHEFINSITLESLLKEEDIAPNFDLLGVDVEGYEYEVFKDFDLNKWSPKMVIIELHDKNPRYASLNEEGHLSYVRDLFLDNGYSILFENPSNTIFVI